MSPRRPARWHGLLPVVKRPGPTSHDIVDIARKALKERRIGHTGTLDPMAAGLLLLCVGNATRLQQYLLEWDKTYLGRVRLGHATTTYDSEGERSEPIGSPPELPGERLVEVARLFTGTIEQLPPPYSAKKVGGRKLYELAREGEAVRVEPKSVVVHHLALESHDPDQVSLELTCSSGFYVRSLANDLGIHLGCGGFLEHLERTRIGPYRLADALLQADLESATCPEEILDGPSWVPMERIELPFPRLELNPAACQRFIHGQEVIVFRAISDTVAAGDRVAVHAAGGPLLGIGTIQTVLARGRTLGVQPATVVSPPPVTRAAAAHRSAPAAGRRDEP